jgi:hypothetical protein
MLSFAIIATNSFSAHGVDTLKSFARSGRFLVVVCGLFLNTGCGSEPKVIQAPTQTPEDAVSAQERAIEEGLKDTGLR